MFSKNEWNPKIREFFLSDSYLERKELYENIEKNAKNFNGNTLDLGCGTKPYQHLFNCDSYVGLEINGGGINDADYFYDGTVFPFKDEEFDNMVSFQVIYQAPNLNALISEMNRVLKLNGKVLITVPFIWFDGGGNMHRRFSEQYTKTKFEEYGFEIEKIEQTNSNLSALCILSNKYINRSISTIRFKLLRVFFRIFITPLFNLLGLLFLKFMKRDNELYIDTILLAKKVKSV